LILSLCSNPTGIAAKLLSLPPLVWIGRISYSLYLWHLPGFIFVALAVHWIRTVTFSFLSIKLTSSLESWQMEALQYIAAIGFAAISYYFIEKPFLKLKNRFN
jgi:peptidoglycan/LPS O-acetylase OafA/YrhL